MKNFFLIMKTKRFIIYLHKILSNHFGILSIKIGKKIPLFGFTPLNGLSVHTISDNVFGFAMAVFMRCKVSKPLLQNQCYMQYDLQKLLTIKY